jgi:hypothetical protein
MDIKFTNSYAEIESSAQLNSLIRIRESRSMFRLAEIALDYEMEDSQRLDALFASEENVKFI